MLYEPVLIFVLQITHDDRSYLVFMVPLCHERRPAHSATTVIRDVAVTACLPFL